MSSDYVNGEPNPCCMYQNVSETDLQNHFSNSECFPSSPVPSWYRFIGNAAGSMSTDCQLLSACGGNGQVWINGEIAFLYAPVEKIYMGQWVYMVVFHDARWFIYRQVLKYSGINEYDIVLHP